MKTTPCYISVKGKPLCMREHLMRQCDTTCGHTSLASAKRAKLKLQRLTYGLKIERGHCPAVLDDDGRPTLHTTGTEN